MMSQVSFSAQQKSNSKSKFKGSTSIDSKQTLNYNQSRSNVTPFKGMKSSKGH